MNNNTTKFYICHKPITVQSHKSWWSNYNVLWGHNNISECEGAYCPRLTQDLLIPQADYRNLLGFVSCNPIGNDKTYQMDITRIKSFFDDYWTLSNFAIYEGSQYCFG